MKNLVQIPKPTYLNPSSNQFLLFQLSHVSLEHIQLGLRYKNGKDKELKHNTKKGTDVVRKCNNRNKMEEE